MKRILFMKRIILLTMLLSAFLAFSSVGVYAAESEDLIKIEAEIERTNEIIDTLIAKTLDEVSTKVDAYNERYIELTIGTEVIRLQDEVSIIENEIAQLDEKDKNYEDYLKKYTYYLEETEKMLIEAQEQQQKVLEESKEKISAILEKELNIMEAEIDELAKRLIEETNKIAQQTIELGNKYGFIIICEWVKVEIYGEIYLIDPLRIVGCR